MRIADTDEQMNIEIDRLKNSPHVALARKELRLKYKKRQYLYNLRNLEKRGKWLEEQGVTSEGLEAYIEELEQFDDEG